MSLLSEKTIPVNAQPIILDPRTAATPHPFQVYPFDVFAQTDVQKRSFRLIVMADDGEPVAIKSHGSEFLQLVAERGLSLLDDGSGEPSCRGGSCHALPFFDNTHGPHQVGEFVEYIAEDVIALFKSRILAEGKKWVGNGPYEAPHKDKELQALLSHIRETRSTYYEVLVSKAIRLSDPEYLRDVNDQIWDSNGGSSSLSGGLFVRLAQMDKVLSGLDGIRTILRADSNCRMDADESPEEFSYRPLPANVIGNLEDGLDALLDVLRGNMERLRMADWSKTIGEVKFPNY